jgi:hypothetical protein
MRKKKEIGLEEMTLKDFIAIFAMQAFAKEYVYDNSDVIADKAYTLAEAMLEKRNGN